MKAKRFESKEVTYKGKTYPSVAACVRSKYRKSSTAICRKALERLAAGWSVSQMMDRLTSSTRVLKKRKMASGRSVRTTVGVEGRQSSVRALLNRSGVTERCFRQRMARGWKARDAATVPSRSRRLIRNTCRDKIVVAFGEAHNIVEWAKITGIKDKTIGNRLRCGWTAEEAVGIKNARHLGHCVHPQPHGIVWQTAKAHGLDVQVVQRRMKNGETLEEAVSRPPLGRHELMSEWQADNRRRELATLGIVI